VLGQTAADGTGLLRAEVEGEQVLLLVRSRNADFCFCKITVSTRAVEVRTSLLKKGRIQFESIQSSSGAENNRRK
jgi:hypothetical protein